MSFGENLKKARKAVGMTQIELARKTGVTERSVYNYEKNDRAPKISIVEKFASALGTSAEVLLDLDLSKNHTFDSLEQEKLLFKLKQLFESGIEDKEKETFFKKVALLYFNRNQQDSQMKEEQQ